MSDRRLLIVPVIAILGFALGMQVVPSFTATSVVSNDEGIIKYWSNVCTTKIDGKTGETTLLGCSHNLFTSGGQNQTRDALSGAFARTDWARFIGVSNDTPICGAAACTKTSGANSTNLTWEVGDCGLSRAAATYSTNLTAGVWFLEKVFTVNSSCSSTIAVNATGLFNVTTIGTAGITYFAGNNFTTASLQTNDQLNVTWSIAVS